MDFQYSETVELLRDQVQHFMDQHVIPRNRQYQAVSSGPQRNDPEALAFVQDLRMLAKEQGLWNLFMPGLRDDEPGMGLSNSEFAPLMEIMGRIPWSLQIFNCNAPNTGNMELLHAAANEDQRRKFLLPLLEGEATSCFSMTEPDVASSDATNIQTSIKRDGDEYVINGRKWFSSNILHPDCAFCIVLGKTDPEASRHRQQSMIVVPVDTPGVEIVRDVPVFHGTHTGGHGEVLYNNVRVPAANLLGEEGDGFAIAQARLGPGRIHYGMRCIGMAELALELMVARCQERKAFGKYLHEHGMTAEQIARSRMEIDQARFLVLHTAKVMDDVGAKAARKEIAMIKIIASELVCNVADRAIQVHGAMGMSPDTPLAELYTLARVMRIGDGPNEVHLNAIAKMEVRESNPLDALRYYTGPE
jgi:acyl-CoA dehydrogenase